MGYSEYDPGVRDQRAWNAGRKLGAKRALKPQQVWAVRFWLDRERPHASLDYRPPALSREPKRSHKGLDGGLAYAAVAVCHARVASARNVRSVRRETRWR